MVNLKKVKLNNADLSGADLHEADLSSANLSLVRLNRVDLRGANLSGARLSLADLRQADLSAADLTRARLSRANLSTANFSGADLSYANLSRVDLTGTNLTGANLTQIFLFETVFGDTLLYGAKGLEACRHYGPSTIDLRTLAKSWPLPLSFLRNVGLPDSYIETLPTLLNQSGGVYSCFVSYSTKDQEFAQKLYSDLQSKGVLCWFAPHDAKGGRKLHEQIDEAIRLYDRLLLILSEHSMNSEWVKTEIAGARQKAIDQRRQVLFPISLVPFPKIRDWQCFDADNGKDSAREIREFFIPDFSRWKECDSYQRALQRLVADLQVG